MKVYLEKAIFINRAPFSKLTLDFSENEIAVLSSVNGKGKTTILSHIVDAIHEMARPHFPNEYEGKENKFYRVSSAIHNLDQSQASFVYFRFKTAEETIDYLDVRNVCTEAQYNDAISIDNKIPFSEFEAHLKESNCVKKVSSNLNKKKAEELFANNILTYFPSYRYEMPGYLNEPYKIKLDFTKESGFSGYLKNPIEVITELPLFANWVMDIVLDLRMNANVQNQILFTNLNLIATLTLSSNNFGSLRFGVGPRGFGSTRIQILENKKNGKQIYPTIFNLSSGESSMICLFGELLRQADNNRNNILPGDVTGIVLIDEIDKHLHIKLQKDVLPLLLGIFPNVQFIVSAHSPFLSMGLADTLRERSKILDIESGLAIEPTNDKQYQEVYEMMIGENAKYKKLYDAIKLQIDNEKELQIITEGKNTEHLKKAISVMDISIMDKIKIIAGAEDKTGDQQLKTTFNIMSKANHSCKFLFVWDCDAEDIVNALKESESFFKFCFQRNDSNSKTQKGIENLYPDTLFAPDVYDEKEVTIDYGGSKKETIFNKNKFLKKISNETSIDIFNNYTPLIIKIKSIISSSMQQEPKSMGA